jgi:putative spermidine/putrescine transport system permease protein
MKPRDWSVDSTSFSTLMLAVASIALISLVLPTVVLIVTSFTESEALSFPPSGFSLRWYRSLGEADQIWIAAFNSLTVAFWTTILSVLLGVSAALALGRQTGLWARSAEAMFTSPLLLPALAFAFGVLVFFSAIGFRGSILPLIIGHTVVCFPFVLRNTLVAVNEFDPALTEASQSLGASSLYTFWRVTLPLISRGIAAGAFIAFMSSFDNIPISLFVADARMPMLPIHMWELIDDHLDVRTAAVSVVIIVFTLAMMILTNRFTGVASQGR